MATAHLQTHDVGTAELGLPHIETTTNSPQMMRPLTALEGLGDPDDDQESDVGEAPLGDSNVGGLSGVAVCISDPLTSRAADVERSVVPGTGFSGWAVARQDTSSGKVAGFRARDPHVHTPPASIALESGHSVWPDSSRVLPQAGSTDHPTHHSGIEPNVFSSSGTDVRSAGNATVESQPSTLDSSDTMHSTSPHHSIDQSLPNNHLARRSSTTCSVAETAAYNSAPGAARSSSPTPVASPPKSGEGQDRSRDSQVATSMLHGGRPSDRPRAPSSVFSMKSGIMGRDEDGIFQRERMHPLVDAAQLRKTVHDLEEEVRYLTPHDPEHISTSEPAIPSLPAQESVGSIDHTEPTTWTGAATGVAASHFVEVPDQSTPAGELRDTLDHPPSPRSPSSHSGESGPSDGTMHVSLVDRIRGEVKVIAGKVKRDPAKIAQGRALMSGDH